ncbi:fimbrial protein [Escherichia coli]|nr:fimbrial protein [Escherichia coli]EII9936984.1 fimbrial protein [Escherichia coli]EKE4260487.1 fimbrial protein [Escherichia coli]
MIKLSPCQLVMLTGILLSPSAFATDINVDFTATVKATTCNIKLKGNNVTDNGNDNYTLKIPKMGLEQIVNKTAAAQSDFTLAASGCSAGISAIDTTLSGGEVSGTNKLLIIPNKTDSTSTTSFIGMGFKRRNADDSSFLKPDNTAKIRWSAAEISETGPGLEMTVALRETTTGQGVPGKFRALATFNFSYQ